MWLIKMAWKNLWRNRNRTAVTIAAIFFAVVLSVITSSLQEGVFGNLVKNVVSFYNGYIQIHKKGYWDEQILDNCFLESKEAEEKILQQQNILFVAPRLESFSLASYGTLTKGCLVVGISPEKEKQITALHQKVIEGKYLEETETGVMIGEGLAQRLQLKLMDTLVLIGQGYHGSTAAGKYKVVAMLKFGSPILNDKVLFMPLASARDLFGADEMLTSYVLSLDNTSKLDATAKSVRASISSAYETMTWEEMMPEVIQHIRTDKGSMKLIQGVLYLLICFGIFGTLLMMMVERKYEMGMLVAIGMKKIKLIQLLLVESVLTVLMGCILGIAVSIPIVKYLSVRPIRFHGELAKVYEQFGFEPIFPTSVEYWIFLQQGLVVLVLGLILSLYPVVQVMKLDPVNAMKK